jgi:hypothetical protein
MFWNLLGYISPHQLQLFVPWPWVQQFDAFKSGDAGSLTLAEGRRNNDIVHVSIWVKRHWYEPSNTVGFSRSFGIYKSKCNHEMQFKCVSCPNYGPHPNSVNRRAGIRCSFSLLAANISVKLSLLVQKNEVSSTSLKARTKFKFCVRLVNRLGFEFDSTTWFSI